FAERFTADLSEKTRTIPLESVVEPKASVAGPALQGLAFTHEEPVLKDLYLNLLASAMDGRTSSHVHPSFVEIIKQLDGAEAKLLKSALGEKGLPIVQLEQSFAADPVGRMVVARHILPLETELTKEPFENPDVPVMVDNW